ncbi:DUF6316 family protein [Dasania marina]|uniref:DUF6316 family protein n=1 Tax=Dasania marina TaxID=471499 RepID=UPI0030DB1A7D|tara:strand:- start:16773 stop:16961 length:189 start_codon:yes stop_codon:yes gene_type:complete
MDQRKGESNNSSERAKRFYQIGNEWFFSSREQLQVGPYSSLDEAEMQLNFYLRHVKEDSMAV